MILSNKRFIWVSNIECYENTRVDLVEDQVTGKQFILKSVRKDANVYVHQFHKEVDTLSKIHHPYMPEIIDVFEEKQMLCLVETYIKGISLKKWISKHPILFFLFKYKIIYDCFSLIEYLHSLDILYIDFKLDNVLIDKRHIYLIDFNGCISNQSTQALLASSENVSPEILTFDQKDFSSDIYALGKVFKPYSFLDMRLLMNKCSNTQSSKRFKTIKEVKKKMVFMIVGHILSILICVFLSVYLLYQGSMHKINALYTYLDHDKDISYFMNAYTYTENQQEGNQQERIQSNLYLWIENDWFDDSIINSNYASFLLRQAIQSQNEMYCDYFLDLMNEKTMQENQNLVIFSKMIFDSSNKVDYEWIHLYLQDLTKHNQSYNDEIDSMDTLLTLLLNQQIVLDAQDQKIFFTLHNTYTKPCEKLEDVVSKYLEYCLLMENHKILISTIPPYYEESFHENEQIQLLIQYVRRSS